MVNMPSDPNSREAWDAIWATEGEGTWRTYPKIYARIVHLVAPGSHVLDLGCGVGKLLDHLKTEKNCITSGIDISNIACAAARAKGHQVHPLTLTAATHHLLDLAPVDYIIGTEFLEHLDIETIKSLLRRITAFHKQAIFAVPNNCMGPDEESQHQQKWTAIEFKHLLEQYFGQGNVRVECIDDSAPRLLGVCNFPKPYKLAFTMPVWNESRDIERVLKSFRGAADYVVIGVDDKTNDDTAAIARRYADEVFFFTWEKHFAKARNVCIEHCRPMLTPNDWIFMSEGHEHLEAGLDELLNLDQIKPGFHVVEVRREDRDNAWMFPWLFRNRSELVFENAAHNILVYDEKRCTQIPAIRTWHEASTENRKARAVQRKGMNRQLLLDKLRADPKDARSCFYLANEWKSENPDKAIEYYQRYLFLNKKNGPERYQARLSMSQCLLQRVGKTKQQEDMQLIYDTLIVASADDWSRNEHWLMLGDLCATQPDRLEQAMRFYELAAVSIGREPLTFMWIEKSSYGWLPAQKLVTIYAKAGMLKDALHWCERVVELLPAWAPTEAHTEVELHRRTIIEKMKETA